MTFTYYGYPEDNEKDEVRFLIQDTKSTGPLLQDEEIYYLLKVFPNPLRAAAMACDSLSAKYAREALSKSIGDLSLDLKQKSLMFREQASRFWILAKEFRGQPQVFAGGISKTQKRDEELNSDRVQPEFYRDMNDLPGTIIGTSS